MVSCRILGRTVYKIMNKQKNITWEIFWEIPGCPPFLTSEPARVFTRGLEEFCGENFYDCILEYRDNTNYWYLDGKTWSKLDKILFDRMLADVQWAGKINAVAKKFCYPCFGMLNSVRKQDYKKLSNERLFADYKKFFEVYIPAHGSGHPANLLEMKNQRLSHYLKEYIKERTDQTQSSLALAEAFVTLITPTKEMSPQQEAKSLYKLLDLVDKNKKLSETIQNDLDTDSLIKKLSVSFPAFFERLKQHEFDWSWTVYNWEGPPNSLKIYIEQIKIFLHQNVQARGKIKELEVENEKILSEKQIIVWHFIEKAKEASTGDIAKNTKVARPTVKQTLEVLLRLKKIERIGLGRSARYRKL